MSKKSAVQKKEAVYSTISQNRDPHYVQRRRLFDSIRNVCEGHAGRVALVGPEGVGKTHLAIELVHSLSQESQISVFWIDADSPSQFWRSLRKIAQTCGIPSKRDASDYLHSIHDWLESFGTGHKVQWCIVIDGCDDHDILFGKTAFLHDNRRLTDYIPKTPNGCVITTTKNESVASEMARYKHNIFKIGPMERKEALVLYQMITRPPPTSDIWMVAGKVVKRLQYHAADIAQASAYIHQNIHMEKEEVLTAVRNRHFAQGNWFSLTGPPPPGNEYWTTAANSWDEVFDRIAFKYPSASCLLSLMGCFGDEEIPKWVLQLEGAPLENELHAISTDTEEITVDNDDDVHHESLGINFEDDMDLLIKRYLVSANEERTMFEIHSQVQASVRGWLQRQGQLEKYQQEYIARMARALPAPEKRYFATRRKILPHLVRVLDYNQEDEACQLQRATVLHNASRFALTTSDYWLADKLIKESIEIRTQLLGESHDMTLESVSLHGNIYMFMGLVGESYELQLKAVETLTTLYGEDNHITLKAKSYLMEPLWWRGQVLDSLAIIEQVADKSKEVFGEYDDNTLDHQTTLAHSYWVFGRLDEAEKLATRVAGIRKRVYGTDNPATLVVLILLVSIYIGQKRYLDAQELQAPLMDDINRVYGKDTFQAMVGLGNLALISANRGFWGDVSRLEDSILEIVHSNGSKGHTLAIGNFTKILALHARQNDSKRVEALLRENIAIIKRWGLGDSNIELLPAYHSLCYLIKQGDGRLEESLEYENEALSISTKCLGLNDKETLTWMQKVAETKHLVGQKEEAMSLLQRCLELRQKVLGPEHPDIEAAARIIEQWNRRQSKRWSLMKKFRLSKG